LAEDRGFEKTDQCDDGCSEEREFGRVARATMTAYVPSRDDIVVNLIFAVLPSPHPHPRSLGRQCRRSLGYITEHACFQELHIFT
jgi:hypothetical protein